jgi:hypothetical protein
LFPRWDDLLPEEGNFFAFKSLSFLLSNYVFWASIKTAVVAGSSIPDSIIG